PAPRAPSRRGTRGRRRPDHRLRAPLRHLQASRPSLRRPGPRGRARHPGRPLRIVLAGKAHPADEGGKELIRQIWELSRDPRFEGCVVFLEDYQMTLARRLVHGVDVWLNTPLRPQEASGTSGMKAAMNGAINLSILDGWWEEGYDDEVDAEALYRVLVDRVIPAYYERDARGLPPKWLELMRASIERLGEQFN